MRLLRVYETDTSQAVLEVEERCGWLWLSSRVRRYRQNGHVFWCDHDTGECIGSSDALDGLLIGHVRQVEMSRYVPPKLVLRWESEELSRPEPRLGDAAAEGPFR